MTDYAPGTLLRGTEVTATVRGEIVKRPNSIGLRMADGYVIPLNTLTDVTVVEPDYAPFTVVRDARGDHYIRRHAPDDSTYPVNTYPWRLIGGDRGPLPDSGLLRPLTVLSVPVEHRTHPPDTCAICDDPLNT